MQGDQIVDDRFWITQVDYPLIQPWILDFNSSTIIFVFTIPLMCSRHLYHWSIPCVIRNNLSLATSRISPSGGTCGWDSTLKLMLNILKLCWKNALNLKCQFTSWGMKTWWMTQKRNRDRDEIHAGLEGNRWLKLHTPTLRDGSDGL
jgi:hypothetical protein